MDLIPSGFCVFKYVFFLSQEKLCKVRFLVPNTDFTQIAIGIASFFDFLNDFFTPFIHLQNLFARVVVLLPIFLVMAILSYPTVCDSKYDCVGYISYCV